MHNNLGYRGFPSSNSSSYSSFSSQYASTPNNNSTRFQRPRFAYAGPPSYPRPRSSASKPNPDPYGGEFESFPNSSYDSEYHLSRSTVDYSHGYMDSMRNNFGDSHLPLNDSLTMNQSRVSSSDSSAYITCNESFHESPLKSNYPKYDSNNSSFSSSLRGNLASYSNLNTFRRPDNYLSSSIGGSALYNNNIGLSSTDSLFRGLTGTFATSAKGTLGVNTRGKRGTFGQSRGNARGRFRKKRPSGGRGGSQFYNTGMDAGKSTWRCEVCSINFTSQVPLDMHLRGAKHSKKLKLQNALNNIQGQIAQVKEVARPDGKKFYCELCDVIANSSLQLQMHLGGTKHKSKLPQPPADDKEEPKETSEDKNAKTELNGKSNGGAVRRPAPSDFSEPQPSKMAKFSCDICNVIVNSDMQLQQHLSSKKHQAKVEGKPIHKPRKGLSKKQDGESEQPMEQSETTDKPKETVDKPKETTSVIGVKTLSASFVKSDTML